MRRIFAITLIAGLIFSTASPVWAAACAGMHTTPMCHRTAAHHHHCDMMMDQDKQDETASPESQTGISAVPGKCPMQCCMQAQAGNGTAVPAISFLPQLDAAEYHVDFAMVVFLTSGFSSHTDRGPPAL